MTEIHLSSDATEMIASINGLAFSISPAKFRNKNGKRGGINDEAEEEIHVLTLAPFTKAPKVNLGQVKKNTLVERNILIVNPQEYDVALIVKNQELQINNIEFTIAKMNQVDFKIKWQPDKPDNYKYSILFEVTNIARLKFIVHAFGICLPPEPKKNRKPLVMLQPLKKEKSALSSTSIAPSDNTNTQANLQANFVQRGNKENNASKSSAPAITKTTTLAAAKPTKPQKIIADKKPTVQPVITTTSYKSGPQISSKRIADKKLTEYVNSLYKSVKDDDDEVDNIDNKDTASNIDKTYFKKNLLSVEFEANSQISDQRRQTSIISSPKLGLYRKDWFHSTDNNLNNECGGVDVGGGGRDLLSTYLKTPSSSNQMHRSLSINNMDTTVNNNLSFVDKTVVFLAGGLDHNQTPTAAASKRGLINNLNTPQQVITINDDRQNCPVTPKLSDFITTDYQNEMIGGEDDGSINDLTSINNNMNSDKKIASTRFIDITVGAGASCTMMMMDMISPNHNKCNLNSTRIPINELILNDYRNQRQYDLDYYEQLNNLKYILIIQRGWRMKKFRQVVSELRFKRAAETVMGIVEKSKHMVAGMSMTKDANYEKLDKEKSEIALRLVENARIERERNLLKCIIRCQRWLRMKLFRKRFKSVKIKQNNAASIIQHKWRLFKFRKHLIALKQEQQIKIKQNNAACIIQREWRLYKLRKHLADLKHQQQIEWTKRQLKCILSCQRSRRMKLFRRSLLVLRAQRQKELYELSLIVKCQRSIRMKLFRTNLAKLIEARKNESAMKIQKAWNIFKFRRSMKKYNKAAFKIQKWWLHEMKERRQYLKLVRSVSFIQIKYKKLHQKRMNAAICIQSAFRMYSKRKQYIKMLNAANLIKKWYKSKHNRLSYIKLKRSLPMIQSKARLLINKQTKAACVIQRSYRLFKFRRSMKKYKSAILCIQRWHRQMNTRYDYLKKKNIISQIQALYRRIYMTRRISAVIRIQCAWRSYLARKTYHKRLNDFIQEKYLNECALKIQSIWRGHRVRKETNLIFAKIRNRLSVYIANRNSHEFKSNTLGARITSSLKILKPYAPIQQLMMALYDLDKVTRLSPECCKVFVNEGAIETLFTFISSCNRSVPHMDLIKCCLQILINLAKYNETSKYILTSSNELNMFINLLNNYQTSNPIIFMNVCIILILLVKNNESIRFFMIQQDAFSKKLTQLYSNLGRKANLRLKHNNEKLSTATISAPRENLLNTTAILSVAGSGSIPPSSTVTPILKNLNCVISFTFEPEWSLCKKQPIDLIDPIGSLDCLLNTLGILHQQQSSEQQQPATPRRSVIPVTRDKSSTAKKSDNLKQRPPLSQSKAAPTTSVQKSSNLKLSHKLNMNKMHMALESTHLIEKESNAPCADMSICSIDSCPSATNNTTITSINGLHSDVPIMNSTSISSNYTGKIQATIETTGGLKKTKICASITRYSHK